MHFFLWTEICTEVQRLEGKKAAVNWNLGRCTWKEKEDEDIVFLVLFFCLQVKVAWCNPDTEKAPPWWILSIRSSLRSFPNQGGDRASFWPQRHPFSSSNPGVQPTTTCKSLQFHTRRYRSPNAFPSWIRHLPAILQRTRRASRSQKRALPIPFCSGRVSMATLDGSWREDFW